MADLECIREGSPNDADAVEGRFSGPSSTPQRLRRRPAMLRTFDGSCANTVEANGTLQEFAAGGSKS